MNPFIITPVMGLPKKVTAHRMSIDGGWVRFFSKDQNLLAAFNEAHVVSVVDADKVPMPGPNDSPSI